MPQKQTSIEKNEKILFHNLQEKRRKRRPRFELRDLFRSTDNEQFFSKGES